MQIHRTAIEEKDGKATVEILISDISDESLAEQFLKICLEIPAARNPLLGAYQKVALRRAQALIDEQIQVIESGQRL